MPVGVDEGVVAAPVEVERVDAETIHLPVTLVVEAPVLAAQRVEIACGRDAVQDGSPAAVRYLFAAWRLMSSATSSGRSSGR